MDKQIVLNISKYAGMFAKGGYTESGYIAVKYNDGMCVTKSHADFENIKDEDIVFVGKDTLDNTDGNFKAACSILLCAFKMSEDVNAAEIVDSKSIVEFSKKKITLPPVLDDMTQICGVSVKCAKSTTASDAIKALSGLRNACFLPDAGALVTGRTLDEVYTASLVLDKAANCYNLTENKGGVQPHKKLNAYLEHIVFKMKYSKKNQASQSAAEKGEQIATEEKPSAIVTDELMALATEVKKAGVKLLEENLVQGTWGNIGVRIDDKNILATPTALDYVMLKPEQMAVVNMETMEWTGSNKPTSEKGIHAGLMLGHPETNATVHTHPFYGCIIAATGKSLPVPAKYQDILGKEIPCAKAALPGTSGLVKNVLAAIGDAKACFLGNHGLIVRGKDLDECFALCRALEDACKEYLLG